MDTTLHPSYPIVSYGFHGGQYGSWRNAAEMERSDSQSTSCSVDSFHTIGSSSSAYSVATDYSTLDPELANLDSQLNKLDPQLTQYGDFEEAPLHTDLAAAAHEPFAVDHTLAAAGSHLPQSDEHLPQTLPLPDPLLPFSTWDSVGGAAWDATEAAKFRIASGWSFGDQGPMYITNQAVGEAFARCQEQRQDIPARQAVQVVLRQQLVDHFNGMDRSYGITAGILEEAAYQLQTFVQGPEAVSICFLAIVGTLAELVGLPIVPMDLENPAPDDQYSGDSAPISAPADNNNNINKERFRCPHPGCEKGASRQADLERHVRIVHRDDDKKPKFQCDYKRCSRHGNPFLRQDHFRDHLRVFHLEDILRRGNRENEEWWAGRAARALHSGWWRCGRCLARVEQADNGWLCPDCGNRCEKERQEFRARTKVPDGDCGRKQRGKGARAR